MGKRFFYSALLMGVALLSVCAVVKAQDDEEEDDGTHNLRTHSIYMPYIGKQYFFGLLMPTLNDKFRNKRPNEQNPDENHQLECLACIQRGGYFLCSAALFRVIHGSLDAIGNADQLPHSQTLT